MSCLPNLVLILCIITSYHNFKAQKNLCRCDKLMKICKFIHRITINSQTSSSHPLAQPPSHSDVISFSIENDSKVSTMEILMQIYVTWILWSWKCKSSELFLGDFEFILIRRSRKGRFHQLKLIAVFLCDKIEYEGFLSIKITISNFSNLKIMIFNLKIHKFTNFSLKMTFNYNSSNLRNHQI